MRAGEDPPLRRVWVTRAAPDAGRTARRLRVLGYAPLVAALIETRPVVFEGRAPREGEVLAFTSAAGVRAFTAGLPPADRAAWRGHPAWAVGAGTAHAVRLAGLQLAGRADAGAAALSARLAGAAPARVLWPRAARPAFDLVSALRSAGVDAEALDVYLTGPADPSSPPLREALAALAAGRLHAVLLHSPSAARALAATGASPRACTWAVALSAACAPDPSTPWRTAVADAPRERDLLMRLCALDSPAASR